MNLTDKIIVFIQCILVIILITIKITKMAISGRFFGLMA